MREGCIGEPCEPGARALLRAADKERRLTPTHTRWGWHCRRVGLGVLLALHPSRVLGRAWAQTTVACKQRVAPL